MKISLTRTFLPGNIFYSTAFYLLLLILILTRLLVFLKVNMNFADGDQPIMWLAARNFADGLFFEPRYYGQNYNTLMEGLFAVPLVWLNIPVYYATPIATHFIFLFPIVFSACYLFYHRYKIHAIVLLSVIACMPPGYDIVNGIPRGFVTGIFFSSFFVPGLLRPASMKLLLLNTLMSAAGYLVNPNSVLITAPMLFYFFLLHYKRPAYYIVLLTGVVTTFLLKYLFDSFYIHNPERVVYKLNMKISVDYFIDNITHLDERFGLISPLTENRSFLLLIFMLLLPFILFRYNRNAMWSYLIFIFILLAVFNIEKTTEGSLWPFYAYSRMYLAIPITLSLFLIFVPIKPGRWLFLLLIPVVFTIYKYKAFESYVAYQSSGEQARMIPIFSMKTTLGAINFYHNMCAEKKVPYLLISTGFWLHSMLNYGGPAIYRDFETQETFSERRYWIREKNAEKIIPSFLFISLQTDFHEKAPNKSYHITNVDGYGLYLITENRMKTKDFIAMAIRTEWGLPEP